MIALADGLPLVRFDSGEVSAFRRDWLLRSLARAAERAGYPKWWLAEHVAESVTVYLAEQWEENVVALPRLATAVRSILQVIGYAEIATHFVPGPPLAQVSLVDLAEEAGPGYELAFFHLLDRRLEERLGAGVNFIELLGLERAVKRLRAKKLWSRECSVLRDEVVAFARGRTAEAGRDVTLSLS